MSLCSISYWRKHKSGISKYLKGNISDLLLLPGRKLTASTYQLLNIVIIFLNLFCSGTNLWVKNITCRDRSAQKPAGGDRPSQCSANHHNMTQWQREKCEGWSLITASSSGLSATFNGHLNCRTLGHSPQRASYRAPTPRFQSSTNYLKCFTQPRLQSSVSRLCFQTHFTRNRFQVMRVFNSI